jgi:sugar O-acyltransferase (sialic acid O-acetyltransferase NeuD family)
VVQEVVIYGAGPFAMLVRRYLEMEGLAQVVAYSADRAYLKDDAPFDGLPVRPFEEIEGSHPPSHIGMFVAIGYKAMRARKLMFDRAKTKGYRLINVISRRAISYPDLEIGENNILMPEVVVEPLARIGHNNVFWSGTMVGHGVAVGDHNYFAARCILGGDSRVGDLCFLGNGAIAGNGLEIQSETQVLPGSVLSESTQAATKYIGNPARAIGTHADTGIVIARG